MYTFTNYKTKKALKDAIAAGVQEGVYQPNDMFGSRAARPDYTGNVSLEGPHFPKPHSWYASAKVVNGVIVKVS